MTAQELQKFPFVGTVDIRKAMAFELAAYVEGLDFSFPATTGRRTIKRVYDTWSTWMNKAMSSDALLPAAAVLPDRGVYDASSFTPRVLEDTWVSDGRGGWALSAVSEYECPFVLLVRATSAPQREAIVRALEGAFVETGTLKDQDGNPVAESPVRYGKVLTLSLYYARVARFTLQAQQLLDSAKLAKENKWLAQFEILGHGEQVVPGFFPAMRPRVRLADAGGALNR